MLLSPPDKNFRCHWAADIKRCHNVVNSYEIAPGAEDG
jgi:hypothetical protein